MLDVIVFCIVKAVAGMFTLMCGVVVLCNREHFKRLWEKIVGVILALSGAFCLLSFISYI